VFVKRVLMVAAAVAVFSLTGCGGGGEAVTTAPAASSSTTSASPTSSASSTTSVNDQVRAACQQAVTEKLAGAEFSGRGSLRAASTEGGKLFTLSGTAKAGDAGHPYTCEATVIEGELTLGAVTVDGQ
jgi:predicted small lipoprotein YifL